MLGARAIAVASWAILTTILIFPLLGSLAVVGLVAGDVFGYDDPAAAHGVIRFFQTPGAFHAIVRTAVVGLVSVLLAFVGAAAFTACVYHTRVYRRLNELFGLAYALPHAAAAIAFSFLFSPAGILSRIFWQGPSPPQLNFSPDDHGLSLILALTLKEFAFLILILCHYTRLTNGHRMYTCLRSMGFSPFAAWWKGVFPLIYPFLRPSILLVLAFSFSVVDMSSILLLDGNHTVASLIIELAQDYRLETRIAAAGGSLVLLAMVLMIAVLLYALERLLCPLFFNIWTDGGKDFPKTQWLLGAIGWLIATGTMLLTLTGLFWLALRSATKQWRYPEFWPRRTQWLPELASTIPADAWWNSIFFAVTTAGVATVLVMVILETGYARFDVPHPTTATPSLAARNRMMTVLMLSPLIIPQVSSVYGMQLLAGLLPVSYSAAVWLGHFAFVLPYTYLLAREPIVFYDQRYLTVARALGLSPWQAVWRVKIPMLLPGLLMTTALAATISFAQYLPTQILGGGRVETPTTIAVTLASGSPHQAPAAFAAGAQVVLALAALALGGLLARYWHGVRRMLNRHPNPQRAHA